MVVKLIAVESASGKFLVVQLAAVKPGTNKAAAVIPVVVERAAVK